MALDTEALAATHAADGYVSAVPIITPEAAAQHRARMEAAEAELERMHKEIAGTA